MQKLKVGDKVKLTGNLWAGVRTCRGSEQTVVSVDASGDVAFWGDGYHWSLHEGWEVELLEHGVKRGDIIKATRKDDPTYTLTGAVSAVNERLVETSCHVLHWHNWNFEVLESAKAIPTENGLYVGDTPYPLASKRVFLLRSGEWSELNNHTTRTTHEELVRLFNETDWNLKKLVEEN